ncbi:hypothetical protein B7R74_02690 [Yersinia pseudotuberculosis]|uniref:hypothetical protein n=1 Tax=Yersinia pseudotuberculosis TaxID=633 RepID=UPI000D0AF2CE|nr:hypothetical protein [Yersinia pseudotuberculosis]PSH23561.1 hypothetical protein B7R74_02690 [Yersinia pseudotuberculosis]
MEVGKTTCNPSTDSGEARSVTIGEFTISQFGDGTLWIEDGEDDAGSFDFKKFEAAIKSFYEANL